MGQRAPGAGRFAPSPSGDLHLGNLRTALLAWLFARSTGRRFLMRIEDLDRVLPGSEQRQLADLAALGVDWDGEIVRQSERLPLHTAAIETLTAAGLTYECFCTRREVQQATFAPHGPDGHYPGTCRDLTDARRQAKRDAGRPPAIRLRAAVAEFTVHDELHGSYCGAVDDVVLRRGDGVPAYNLAVVVDDAAQGVDQVVRGDDLLSSAPRQGYLASLLSLPAPRYAHVSLALNAEGKRLAKRDGAVTLADQRAEGRSPDQVRAALARSLGMAAAGELPTMSDLLTRFVPGDLPRKAWIFTEA